MFSNRVEITLQSVLGTFVLGEDPINYDQSEINLKRSEETYGIFLSVINNLEFIGEAKNYLEELYGYKGVNAKCKLIRREKHPTTDDWLLRATGYLDFSTRKITDNKLSISFVEGGLREIFTSQFREKFELNRTTDINGKPIPALQRDVLALKGRDIYLLSRLSTTSNFTIHSGIWRPNNYEFRDSFAPFEVTVDANSDPQNIQPAFPTRGADERWREPSLSNMFFASSDRVRGKVQMTANIKFTIGKFREERTTRNHFFEIVLDRYDANLNRTNREVLSRFDGNFYFAEGTVIELPILEKVFSSESNNELKEGDSLALGIYFGGEFRGGLNLDNDSFYTLDFYDLDVSITWAEDSFYNQTTNPCLTAYNAFSRLSEIYTGTPCFESYLLDGTDNTLLTDNNHELVFAPGGWIRNLKVKTENEELLEWPMEMSFEDGYKSIHGITPVGYGIATQGNRQSIVFEKLPFFFQRTVVGNLGKIQIKERSTASEFCYQSLKFGYTKGGDYEKPLGLDEYNTQSSFRTPITIVDNAYEALSPFRADSYGAEDARRKQYEEFPDEDTPYDKDNFMFDVKKTMAFASYNAYDVRTYTDDFEQLPTGVYSPETAYNLNLSIARNKKRHEPFFNIGTVKLNDELIQFLNSKGNSQLKTKKAGEDYVKENEDKLIQDNANPLFEPEWIDAEAEFSQEILDKLSDTTLINGREINNYYCLWEFTNEKNQPEYAYIFSVKSKDKFTYKLLKAYGI